MSLFHAKQYKVIAKAVNDSRTVDDSQFISVYWLLQILCFMFKLDNPRFDPETFRRACGEHPEHSD